MLVTLLVTFALDLACVSSWQAVRDYDVRIIDSLGHACPMRVGGHGDAAATACEDCVALGLVVVVTATDQVAWPAPVACSSCVWASLLSSVVCGDVRRLGLSSLASCLSRRARLFAGHPQGRVIGVERG